MEQKPDRMDISKVLSNNEKLTEKDMLALLALIDQGRMPNPKLLKGLKMRGSDLKTPESAGFYRKKLEDRGVIEGYQANRY